MKYILIILFLTLTLGLLPAQAQRYAYDDFNRLVEVTYDNGLKLKYAYDKLGNRLGYEVIAPSVQVQAKAILDGAYRELTGVMTDALLKNNLIPSEESYTALGFTHVGGGGETIADPAGVFGVEGADAIVDWVMLELRDPNTPAIVLQTHSALLQRDGDIVGTDGVSPVLFENTAWGDYYLAVRHRNHLGVMTAAPVDMAEEPVPVDFTNPATSTWGAGAQRNRDNLMRMWSGNVNMDGKVVFIGDGSDYNALETIILSNPDNTSGEPSFPWMGYLNADLNLDGKAVYQGAGSDIPLISTSVVENPLNPTYDLNLPVTEQLPQEQMN